MNLAAKHVETFRRNYGYILDVKGLKSNRFKKIREYIEFDNQEDSINPEHVLAIPGGYYATCVVQVEKGKADFSILNTWLRENSFNPYFIIAEEIGLQLFDYLDKKHPCEVRIFVK